MEEQRKAVRAMQEYIKAHFAENITPADLAKASNFSPWYDYTGSVPDGFEVIDLPAATYLLFRGEPFEEEKYESAIVEIWDAEKKYDPEFIGYEWDDMNPRIQLEPRGDRGYIELVPVRKKQVGI